MADTTFTDQNFQQEVASGTVVVDFWAPWCGPCRVVSPTIDQLAEEYNGKVKVGKMNVDENPQIAGEFGIMSIPTVMIFKDGQPVQAVVGAKSKDEYKKAIDQVVG